MLAGCAAVDVTWEAAAAWRARRHRLGARAPRAEALDVASAVCGLHAQVLSCAELSLWARVADLRRRTSRAGCGRTRRSSSSGRCAGRCTSCPRRAGALARRARDVRPLAQAELVQGVRDHARGHGGADRRRGGALAGRCLTREQLAAELGEERLGESWGAYLKPVAFRGLLCFGPDAGRHVTFTRPDTWLERPVEPWDGEAALDEVARRFLHAYAPATPDDFRRWWAISEPRARRRLQRLDLAEVSVAGEPALVLAEDADALAAAEPDDTVRLLPGFDPWVIGATRHSDRLMPEPSFRERCTARRGGCRPCSPPAGASSARGATSGAAPPCGWRSRPFVAVDGRGSNRRGSGGGRARRLPRAPDRDLDWVAG
jgi:hypothetical protein